ncbi:stage II sporulation protein R [Lachnospiraceae bacterium BSM-380-WT-5A]|uniref:Stage II sporulation protein R n=1 Tax=Oliverpabstia intestinalis TaxID=2606633 RepID=A0A7X2P1Z2_9FIRM|nr:stage II sporulation protein R [Oliverpabstia intestinalis]MST66028.1 stage II sporulation protein R [Oliverpabstia intestinalis]
MKHQSHATLTALLFLSLLLVTESPRYLQDKSTSTLQQQIATQVLRFHIRANSDTVADQQKKLRIKQSLLEWLIPILSENTSKSETIQCIRKNLPDIRKEATRMAAPEPVTVTLQKEWFPEKTYGTCTFPEGIYDALRVDIGQAKGHNWWCVLYPSLCFADALEPSMTEEGEEKLQQVLDEDAYDLLLHPQKLKIRFRLEFFLRNR